jgi:hypothetical protein
MIGTILAKIAGFFGATAAGSTIGNAVANTASTVAVIAALAPAAIWLIAEKDTVALSLTYGELALFSGLLFFVLKIVHYTRNGNPQNRNGA